NVKMFLALLLSGFFMRRRWWIRALLPVFMLPWALPSIPAFVSFHWMLIGEEGLVDRLLWVLFALPGPLWFNNRWLALAWNDAAQPALGVAAVMTALPVLVPVTVLLMRALHLRQVQL